MALRWDGFSEEDINNLKHYSALSDEKLKNMKDSESSMDGLQISNLECSRSCEKSTSKRKDVSESSLLLMTQPLKVSSEHDRPETAADLALESAKYSQDHTTECTDNVSASGIPLNGLRDSQSKSLTSKLVMPSLSQPLPNSVNLSDFKTKHRLMEEHNRACKVFLAKALEDRKKQTHAEQLRLTMIQEELQKLDQRLSCDVSIIRNQIEAASQEFMEAQKRYDRAEKEFLDAKLNLYNKLERKELLTHHLCTIIEQNEMRKAQKLSELMEKLQMPEMDVPKATDENTLKKEQSDSTTSVPKRKVSSEIILTPTSVELHSDNSKSEKLK